MKVTLPLPSGCVFREEFRNPKSAADNGIVVTGSPIKTGYAAVTSGNTILVPKLISLSIKPLTIIADSDMYAAGAGPTSYQELFRFHSAVGARLIFGRQKSDGTLYVSDTANSFFSSAISAGRRLIAVALTGTTATFYSDGVAVGTGAFTSARPSYGTSVSIGSAVPVSTTNFWTLPLYGVQIYNYAMTESEIKQNYYLTRGF